MRVTWVGSGPKRYYYLSNSVRDGKKVKTIHIKKIGRLDELGYLNHEDLTNEKFVECPYYSINDKPSKMYSTGDLGKWTENSEIICLRVFFNIILRKIKIENK